MIEWAHTVNIKELIFAGQEGKPLAEVAAGIVELLRPLLKRDVDVDDLEEIIEELEDGEYERHADEILENLYDWADENRVWLGP